MKRKYIFAICLAFFLLLFLILKSNLLTIQKINIQPFNISCVNDKLLENDLDFKGQNIFLFDQKKAKQKILNKYYCIKDVFFKLSPSQQIEVNVIGRQAFSRLAVIKNIPFEKELQEASPSSVSALIDKSMPQVPNGLTLVTDETGFVFDETEDTLLPVIFLIDQNIAKGRQLDKDLFENIVLIFNKFKEFGLVDPQNLSGGILLTKIMENNIIIKANIEVVLSSEKNILKQLASLQLILQKAKIDGKEMKSIDLRFDKPVVNFQLKK